MKIKESSKIILAIFAKKLELELRGLRYFSGAIEFQHYYKKAKLIELLKKDLKKFFSQKLTVVQPKFSFFVSKILLN